MNTDQHRWLSGLIVMIICLDLCSSVGAASPHKFHVSVAQLAFNEKEQSVEIMLRVFTDDLENALSQHAKRPIKIDPAIANQDKQVGATIMAYLRASFAMKSKAGRPVRFSWVGLEGRADMCWLYIEGKLPGGLAGAQLRNKIFCDLFNDQINIVNAKIHNKQIGLMFEPKDDFRALK